MEVVPDQRLGTAKMSPSSSWLTGQCSFIKTPADGEVIVVLLRFVL